MSDNDSLTRFHLELPDFELSLSGDRASVEELYRLISHDLLPVLLSGGSDPIAPGATQNMEGMAGSGFTWVYGCTTYYNKVYAVDDAQLRNSLLGPCLQLGRIRRIYLDSEESELCSTLCGGAVTLWAEFTDEGRERFRP
ncbi:MAG: hypothetical protein JW797_01080 [Bradymonadales bacterium]|nr:hypothetical protein [Bradymonadales bacterium]